MNDKPLTPYEELMSGDVVMQEVWRAKEALAAEYGHDSHKLFERLREREKTSGHVVVNFEAEAPEPAEKP